MAGEYKVEIIGLDKLRAALQREPQIAEPTLQRAIDASQALLGKHTRRGVIPWRTGFLLHSFQFRSEHLLARWFPTAKYALFVHDGTRPHLIKASPGKVLADGRGGFFGKIVNHPGTRANPFMPAIIREAKPEIDTLFTHALDIITKDIAAAAK